MRRQNDIRYPPEDSLLEESAVERSDRTAQVGRKICYILKNDEGGGPVIKVGVELVTSWTADSHGHGG